MLKRLCTALVAGIIAMGAFAPGAAADPKGDIIPLTCDDGQTVEVAVNGNGDFTPGHLVGGTAVYVLQSFDATFTFTLYIAGHTITNTAVTGRSGIVGVENDVSDRDYYYADTGSALRMNETNLVAAPNQASMTLGLLDPSSTALDSTALPLAAPVLSEFEEGGYLVLSARNSNGTKELFYVGGPVSEIRTNEIVVLESRRISASTAQLAWPLYANSYTLQSTTNLANPNWQTVGTAVVNTATEHTVAVSIAGPQRFYRLKK